MAFPDDADLEAGRRPLIVDSGLPHHPMKAIVKIKDVQYLPGRAQSGASDEPWRVQINHAPRDGGNVADVLGNAQMIALA